MPPRTILYVEDEENDVLLLKLGLAKAGVVNPLKAVADGQEAVAYLGGSGQYADRELYPLPGLVLLDLNLPRLSGLKVLQWIREQPQFAGMPVVVYTSSDQPSDLEKARQLGANEYVLKPSRVTQIAQAVQGLKKRWMDPLQEADRKSRPMLRTAMG